MKFKLPQYVHTAKIGIVIFMPTQGLYYVDISWEFSSKKGRIYTLDEIYLDLEDLYYSTYYEKNKTIHRFRMNKFQLDHLKSKLN